MTLSFTVNGPVGFDASSDQLAQLAPYQFPATLLSFDLDPGGIGLSSFTGPDPNSFFLPEWNFSLGADTNGNASLTLDFLTRDDSTADWRGQASTTGGSFEFASDNQVQCGTIGQSCIYTGLLVASDPPDPAPEPSSMWIMAAALTFFVGRAGPIERLYQNASTARSG